MWLSSFATARLTKAWRRHGEATPTPWTFTPENIHDVAGNVEYIHESWLRLNAVPNPIRLTYEDVCEPGASSPELDEYFKRPIRLDNPKGPTSGESYVTNWDEFERFVMRCWETLSNRTGDPRLS